MDSDETEAMRDHPRIHGEHLNHFRPLLDKSGSPPHTRGTPLRGRLRIGQPGITPAYTGNTSSSKLPCKPCGDHPRIHGEHTCVLYVLWSYVGSPPHTRGTLNRPSTGSWPTGITPAYTGNTETVYQWYEVNRDHPRIHGEHCKKLANR